jgi:hypothetical protein
MRHEERINYRKKYTVYCTNPALVKIQIKHEDVLFIVMLILSIIFKKISEFEVKNFALQTAPQEAYLITEEFPFHTVSTGKRL